ncbi:hypothetical protein J7L49_05165 [Candidatus Bathyarchaeota archaeon]|nr:hypothetical protein [Candidatus Bathyarchaeota archaeon]
MGNNISTNKNVVVPEGLASKEELLERLSEAEQPLSLEQLIQILGSTVKHDDINKAITFLTMLLTYTEEDQINLGFLAESSTGKSYIPLELAWYFPKDDVIKLGYASPTSFFHDYGEVLKDPVNNRVIIHIDLHRKILIFLDQPHDQLLQRLRSLLSHDDKQIVLKITDRREKSGLRTKTVVVKGFPTVIFCSAKFKLQDQEKTRLLLLSPEISQEKLRESLALKIERESDRESFYERMNEDPERQLLQYRVWMVRRENIKYVKIPEELRAKIYNQFLEDHKHLIPRHQRDISRLLAIIKGFALLNFMHREKIEDTIIVNDEDVEVGFRLYYQVSEANELGLSPEIYNIYVKIKPYFENNERKSLTIMDFQRAYHEQFHKPIGYDYAKLILKDLTSVGVLVEFPDPNDRRFKRFTLPEIYESQVWGIQKTEQKKLPHTANSHISQPETERLIETLRGKFDSGTELDFEVLAEQLGLSEQEANSLFWQLVNEGKLGRDSSGYWRWV